MVIHQPAGHVSCEKPDVGVDLMTRRLGHLGRPLIAKPMPGSACSWTGQVIILRSACRTKGVPWSVDLFAVLPKLHAPEPRAEGE